MPSSRMGWLLRDESGVAVVLVPPALVVGHRRARLPHPVDPTGTATTLAMAA
ncbi:hypothetical protein [Actinacidiphila sp. bgisy160]|uniref:hypothetical protein n=1 Tax=Actinacidiphila sp. bgisy160 TaxID=3413796 RepID=UPI003D70602C